MSYWFNSFTGTTWREFRDAGANVSGFRHRQHTIAKRVQPGDIFLCYLTGVMRWAGALEVAGRTSDTTRIWKEEDFPVRFSVRPLILLEPEHGVPMEELEGLVKFYASSKDKGKFKGIVRRGLNVIDEKDGEVILSLLRRAEKTPVSRPVDPKKLARKVILYRVEPKQDKGKQTALVSVPEPEGIPQTETSDPQASTESATTRHVEI
jgi:hypothetical protein